MKITLVGSRWFGAEALKVMQREGIDVLCVVVPTADDRLALAAQAANLGVHVLANPLRVPPDAIADGTELIVSAHSHAFVSAASIALAPLGGIGYHPSLLPRHRGIAAVEWTIRAGDAIAGGTIYHLADRMDAGAIAAQQWCFVKPGETARELWERALAPLGLTLLGDVVREAARTGVLPATPQDETFATQAPKVG
jgi:methionyl-tRNA formyltransferase